MLLIMCKWRSNSFPDMIQNFLNDHVIKSSVIQFPVVKFSNGPGGSMSQVVGLPNNSYKPITNVAWIRAGFVNYKKSALECESQVIKFISCLPMVGGSLQVLRLLPPLKLVAMILLKVALNTINQIKSLIHINNKICNFVQLSEPRYIISSV